MVRGYKTGGRLPGSKNKPKKVMTTDDTSVSPPVDTAGAGGGAAAEVLASTRVRAREATSQAPPGFPKYRLARVDGLIPNERNARLHTRESVDALARQIGETGWTNPILVAGR